MDLVRRIDRSAGEFLLFALTPPRAATERERVQQIADATIARGHVPPSGVTVRV